MNERQALIDEYATLLADADRMEEVLIRHRLTPAQRGKVNHFLYLTRQRLGTILDELNRVPLDDDKIADEFTRFCRRRSET